MAGSAKDAGVAVELNQAPRDQHAHAIGQDHGLLVVVGHEDRGDALLAEDAAEIADQGFARRLVERREGLVQQEELRLDHEGAGERRALRLPARQRARPAPGQLRDREAREPARDARRRSASRATPRKRRPMATLSKTVVSARSGSWKTLAMRRLTASAALGDDRLALEAHRPRGGRLERADDAEEARLARAVGPDDREHFALRHA